LNIAAKADHPSSHYYEARRFDQRDKDIVKKQEKNYNEGSRRNLEIKKLGN